MTFNILKDKALPLSYLSELEKKKDYSFLGEFYEDHDNSHGGVDYPVLDLQDFLRTHSSGEEYGILKNYSSDLKTLYCVSILVPHTSRNKYIRKHYQKYRVYVSLKR